MTTHSLQNSIVHDLKLAPEGHLKIDWVEAHMPVLNRIRQQFEQEQPFKGLKVTICLHLEAKTAYLAKVVQAGGAEVTITGSNPLSTQDDVCAALVEDGVTVLAKYNPDPAEFKSLQIKALETKPDLIIDDGGDLVTLLQSERPDLISTIRGGAEETTTGIIRLKALEKRVNSTSLWWPLMMLTANICSTIVMVLDSQHSTALFVQPTWLWRAARSSWWVMAGVVKGLRCVRKGWEPTWS